MVSDIVARLREDHGERIADDDNVLEAAEEIVRLRAALEIADQIVGMAARAHEIDWNEDRPVTWRNMRCADYRKAREACAPANPPEIPVSSAQVRHSSPRRPAGGGSVV